MADISWHMTSETYAEYQEVFGELVSTAKAGNTIGHEFAKDKLRSLPGYPNNIHQDLDRVVPVVDDTTSRIVSVGSIH